MSFLGGSGLGGPVRTIEVSGKGGKKRLAIAAGFLLLGVAIIAYTMIRGLSVKPGWTTIEPNTGSSALASELSVQYCLGDDATAQKKEVTLVYTEALVKAEKIFSATKTYDDTDNLACVNNAPNETVTVDSGLYAAFETLQASGSRSLYCAPIFEQYNSVFQSQDDAEAKQYDPSSDVPAAEFVKKAAAFVQDSAHVELRLLGNNQVCLYVSDAYMAFAKEYGVETFLDFYRMRNAFVVDYIGAYFAEKGFRDAYIASVDGYSLCMYEGEDLFNAAVYAVVDGKITQAASITCSGPCAVVSLHSFSAGDLDKFVYEYSDGQMRTAYIDLNTGMSKAAAPHLLAYSSMTGCAGVLLDTEALYTADAVDHNAVRQRALRSSAAVDLAWCEGTTVYYTAAGAAITAEKGYTAEKI